MARGESNRRVFLIGFMGAGKTSVGQVLARKLGWGFTDLDRLIEAREQKTVAEIFAALGEAGFRAAESAVLTELLEEGGSPNDLVIALGGGTFAQAANRDALLKANAMTILLEAPLHELQRRCASDSTPCRKHGLLSCFSKGSRHIRWPGSVWKLQARRLTKWRRKWREFSPKQCRR